MELVPANVADLVMLPEVLPPFGDVACADRNYWDPARHGVLARTGFHLLTPFKKRRFDPNPAWSRYVSHLRENIETVISQLTDRFQAKVVRARDFRPLCHR